MKRSPHATQAACDETQRWLLVGSDGESRATQLRAEGHLGRCPACQLAQIRIVQIHDQMHAATPPLDDVRRARMAAQLSPALDEMAARLGARNDGNDRSRMRAWSAMVAGRLGRVGGKTLLIAGATFAAAAALVLSNDAGRLRRASIPQATRVEQVAPTPLAPTGPQPSPTTSPAAASDPAFARLEPFRVTTRSTTKPAAKAEGAPTQPLLGGRFDRLDVPAGTTVRARLGRQARVSLIGPALLEITSSSADAIEVRLDHGQLVADYDHAAGGRLRVRSPDGVTDVIGTLFSVDVDGGHSRVAVARGRVWVEGAAGTTQILDGGQAWNIGRPRVEVLGAPARALLQAHARDVALASAFGPGGSSKRPPSGALAVATPFGASRSNVGAPAVSAPPVPKTIPPELAPRSGIVPPAVPPPPALLPPAPAPTAAPSAAAAPPPITSEALYRAAEADMRRRDWRSAQQRLTRIVAAGSHDPIEDVARYELAQLALRQGDRAQAERQIEDLLASDREPALRLPAGFLKCEMKAEAGDVAGARACLITFRQQHPGSAHDRAALGWLVRLAGPSEICGSARGWIDEYLRRYPRGPDAAVAAAAAEIGRRCPR